MNSGHISVLLDEVVDFLAPKDGGIYIDATVGSGGHAERILELSSPGGRLVGIDIDPFILKIAEKRLESFGNRCKLVEGSYVGMSSVVERLNISGVDGIIFDLGANTEHFKNPERGFSFTENGPLDMRFNPHSKITAKEIINEWDEKDLVRILRRFGEERNAKRIVRCILETRKNKKINSTKELVEIITKAAGWKREGRIHPATRTFQALRIAVNDELKNIETAIPEAIDILNSGGRVCVISFHSLEDRIIKNTFRALSEVCECPPGAERCLCGKKQIIKIITRKPVTPKNEELVCNARARSAKLRVAEKI